MRIDPLVPWTRVVSIFGSHPCFLSRKVCKFEQLRRGKSVTIVAWGQQVMFNYPRRKTILCIDDDDGMLDYQKVLLERRGYAEPTAASARQRLQIAAPSRLPPVILHYHTPYIHCHH